MFFCLIKKDREHGNTQIKRSRMELYKEYAKNFGRTENTAEETVIKAGNHGLDERPGKQTIHKASVPEGFSLCFVNEKVFLKS